MTNAVRGTADHDTHAPRGDESPDLRLTRLLGEFRASGGFRSGPDALRLWAQIQDAVRQANDERMARAG